MTSPLTVRRQQVDLHTPWARHWAGGDAFRSAWFNALSFSFPAGEQLFIDTSDPGFRQRYAAEAEAREAALHEALAHAGVDTLELSTDDDLLETLLRFAALRRQRGRIKVGGRFPAHLRSDLPQSVAGATP